MNSTAEILHLPSMFPLEDEEVTSTVARVMAAARLTQVRWAAQISPLRTEFEQWQTTTSLGWRLGAQELGYAAGQVVRVGKELARFPQLLVAHRPLVRPESGSNAPFLNPSFLLPILPHHPWV